MPKSKLSPGRGGKWVDLAPSMIAAASRLGVPLIELQAAKAAGCDAFFAGGPVDPAKFMEWRKTHPFTQDQLNGDASSKSEEELRKLRAERQMKEHKLELAKRLAIPADEIRRTFTRYVVAAKSKTWAAIKTASQEAGLSLGLTSDQMLVVEEKVSARVRVAFEELSRCEWGKMECPKCKEEIKA